MPGFMPNAAIAGIIGRTGRGGQNLYGLFPVERAWGHVCKKGEIKRVIKGSGLSATGKEVTDAHKIE